MSAGSWTAFGAGVVLTVGVASIVTTCDVRADPVAGGSSKYYRPGIACPNAIAAFRALEPHGYERLATMYRTEYGPGYMRSVPVAYVFKQPETMDYRTVHCLGAGRGPVRPMAMAGGKLP